MYHRLLLLLSVFLSFNASAQERFIRPFAPLDAPRLVVDMEQLESLTEIILAKTEDLIFCEEHLGGDEAWMSMLKKRDGQWHQYSLPFYESVREWPEFVDLSDDGKYAFITTLGSNHMQGADNEEQFLYVVDVVNASICGILTYESAHFWEFSSDPEKDELVLDEYSKSTSAITIDGNHLSIVKQCFGNGQFEDHGCVDYGGVYEFGSGFLRKIKVYDPATLRMYPILYAGDVGIGMSRNEFEDACKGCVWTDASAQSYGCFSGDICFEVTLNGKVLMGVLLDDETDLISRIVAVSPEYVFGGLSTQSTLKQILKLYPHSACSIDIFSGWEVVTIPELNVSCIFKTNDANRIAEYGVNLFSGEKEFLRFANKKAKVDFIQLGE